jgi:hypothetical protein
LGPCFVSGAVRKSSPDVRFARGIRVLRRG